MKRIYHCIWEEPNPVYEKIVIIHKKPLNKYEQRKECII